MREYVVFCEFQNKLIEIKAIAKIKTRIHSSRMRTVRCSGDLPRAGCLPRKGVCSGGGCLRGRRCVCQGGVCVCLGGVCPGGVSPSACWDTHPSVNRMTDACENINFPQLLRAVIRKHFGRMPTACLLTEAWAT